MNTFEQTLVSWCVGISIFCILLTVLFLYLKVVWLYKYINNSVVPAVECEENKICKNKADKYSKYLKISFAVAIVAYTPLMYLLLAKYFNW